LHFLGGGWLVNTTNFHVEWLSGFFGIREVFVDDFLRRSRPTMRDVTGIALHAFIKLLLGLRSSNRLLLAGFGVLRSWTKRLLTEDLLFPKLICICQALLI